MCVWVCKNCMCVYASSIQPLSVSRSADGIKESDWLSMSSVCARVCEEEVSVKLSGEQLINEALEMFYCTNTHTHHLCGTVNVCVSPAVESEVTYRSDFPVFL